MDAPVDMTDPDWAKRANRYISNSRELLQAKLLGELCYFGAGEVDEALYRASAQYAQWLSTNPSRSTFLQIKYAVDILNDKQRRIAT